MKFKARRELKRTKIEIIPMIDTIFFLLVFFMLSSLALTKINGLKVNLPKTETMPQQPNPQLMLTIDKDQHLYLNKEPISLDQLTEKLKAAILALNLLPEEASFVINADASVPHGLVVQSIDDSRLAGITHFAIATTPLNGAKPAS